MGTFFSNIHVRKSDNYSLDRLKEYIISDMTKKGFTPVEASEESDVSVTIFEPEASEWVSVASDEFNFSTLENIQKITELLSLLFETDVLAAACEDSDYLLLNLVNKTDGTDGWINVGSLYGMKMRRRTSLAAWKKKVSDFEKLKEIAREKYVFAEEAFCAVAPLLHMQPAQTGLEPGGLPEQQTENVYTMAFRAPEGMEKELPKLTIPLFTTVPCKIGESACVFVNNQGGKSKGIGILFFGDYIEKDEIVFEDVTFESDYGSEKRKVVPITLEKVKCSNGTMGLYWENPDFVISPAVSDSVPLMKRMDLESKKSFGVRFTPKGNSRKVLDIRVILIPLENKMDGQVSWYVWRGHASKAAYIEQHNELRRSMRGMQEGFCENMLHPEDYDL